MNLAICRALTLPLALLLLAAVPARAADTGCVAPVHLPRVNLLLLGEMHGSVEAPAFAGRIACAYADEGPAALGLEVPSSEQAAIDRYLASDGDASARAALLASAFWKDTRDGRSSAAMVDLIEQARVLGTQGKPLSVFAFDAPSGPDRDASLANALRAFRDSRPDTRIVALMGNIHASLTPMTFGTRTVVTTGSLLEDLEPASILLLYQSGSIWACMPDCGLHQVHSKWGAERSPGWYATSPMDGYAAAFVLPSITASPPAATPPVETGVEPTEVEIAVD